MRCLLQRDTAVLFLVLFQLAQLDSTKRRDLLLDFWPPGDDSPALPQFPVNPGDYPDDYPDAADDPLFNPILLGGLVFHCYGVSNDYIAHMLRQKKIVDAEVVGIVEELQRCVCCGYMSTRGGLYDICSICLWEDDGTIDDLGYSGPNHMTLGEYRSEFLSRPLTFEQRIKYLK